MTRPPDLPANAAVVALGPGGLDLARRLAHALPGASVHGLEGRVADAPEVQETFTDTAGHLRRLFTEGRPIVGLCAAGILIRAIAPVIGDKRTESPVVAVAEDGSAVVPLLGGHRGANRLASAIAEVCGVPAALTTAGDVRFGVALDDPPTGWHIANPEAAKGVAAALLAGEPVSLEVTAGDAGWLTESSAVFADGGKRAVRVTERAVADPGPDLVLHPPVLALGVGCERGVAADELVGLALDTLDAAGLARGAVACVVSLDLKADEAAVQAVARALHVPVRFFGAAELEALTPRLANPSDAVFRAVGCHGVAEGAALAAAGPEGTLVVEKTGSPGLTRATSAVAKAVHDIDAATVGRPQGRLTVVGIGPGAPDWRTPEAVRALTQADHVVGYRLYLDLIADLIGGKACHQSGLSEEEARARLSLDLAARGNAVALVSSGDAGIYALAALVFELLDREDNASWNRVAVSVAPGVSAFQAAAARMGAPVGHDFCAISLSDLLTPWADIEGRLKAAAEGDFVVALYNPVSKRRRAHLTAARDILLTHRPDETPVVLARNIGRDGEQVAVIRLADLQPDHADMLTMVLIGSSRTVHMRRGVRDWVYTPRGYGGKMDQPSDPLKT